MSQADSVYTHPAFKGLSNTEIDQLLNYVKIFHVEADNILIKEHEQRDSCYLVLSGFMEIFKEDEDGARHIVAVAKSGDVVGSIALFDSKSRSASVCTKSACQLIEITQQNIQALIALDNRYYLLLKNIGATIAESVRETNIKTINFLREKVNDLNIRVAMGKLMLSVIIILSFLSFFNMLASKQMDHVAVSSYITIPLTLVLLIFLVYIFKQIRLPLHYYGLTLKNAKQSILGGIIYSIPICLLTLLVKWLLIMNTDSYSQQPLFTPYASIDPSAYANPSHAWAFSCFVYVMFVVPLQELMSRSGLQAALEYMLSGRYAALWAIIASNIIFMTAHAFMSFFIAFLVFIPGLYFGWLFYKYRNLLAPVVAHALIGIWGLNIVGF